MGTALHIRHRAYCAVIIMLLFSPASIAQSTPTKLSYNHDIRPILSQNCFKCHGPDKNTRKADLRLDLPESAYELLDGQAALVPGNSEASELIEHIFHEDPDELMPPPDSGLALTQAQKETLRLWVEQGAEYQPLWSLITPQRPALPVDTASDPWVRTPIDAFILERLHNEGVAPSPAADPVTLIRRVYFDLTGLPPDTATVDAFAANPTQEAYAAIVEKLLTSPAYGERMAEDWLDQVRYADTNGYHGDEYRSVWPYRDYVINAFNANKPFDQFTIEQIAGDLLPNATREQKIAATYNRLNQLTAEGGAQPKEYIAKYAADRVRALSSVWLGATMGCAECHDHKFDRYTAKDFYMLSAFFADIDEVGVYGAGQKWEPIMELPSDEQINEEQRLRDLISFSQAKLDVSSPELEESQIRWEEETRQALGAVNSDWQVLTPESLSSANGTEFKVLENNSVLTSGPNPDKETYTVTLAPTPGKLRGIRLEALMNPAIANGLAHVGNFVLTGVEIELHQNGTVTPLAIDRAKADYEQKDQPIAAAIDGSPETGWGVDGHIKLSKNEDRAAMFLFRKSVEVAEGARIVVRLKHESPFPKHNIGCFRISMTNALGPAINDRLGLPTAVYNAVRIQVDLRKADEKETLAAYYRGIAPELDTVRAEIRASEDQIAKLKTEIPYILETRAVAPREVHILPRGNFLDETGEVVQPLVPAVLPALPAKNGRYTRLDLANWIVSPENPLPTRVIMNRTWDIFFGTGLSKVLDDLGAQGEIPTHPELLDWLAVEFRESGWDMKHMIRLIVTSNAYCQDSKPRPELNERDPYNRLLARQTRMRLEAESVRDNALSVSGLLSAKMGGPSVFPYQPDGYWDNCNTFTGPLIYTTSEGEDQYRRGLYTLWKRSFLHPSMLAFDAPTREECTAERNASNTPLQALVLLNDPTYVEAARVLAAKTLNEATGTDGAKIAWMFKRALSRTPTAQETALLLELLAKHRIGFEADAPAADTLLQLGLAKNPENIAAPELAAWTSIARAILNLNETITRS